MSVSLLVDDRLAHKFSFHLLFFEKYVYVVLVVCLCCIVFGSRASFRPNKLRMFNFYRLQYYCEYVLLFYIFYIIVFVVQPSTHTNTKHLFLLFVVIVPCSLYLSSLKKRTEREKKI